MQQVTPRTQKNRDKLLEFIRANPGLGGPQIHLHPGMGQAVWQLRPLEEQGLIRFDDGWFVR